MTQVIARGIGAALAVLTGWLGAEVSQGEIDNIAFPLASAIGAVGAFLFEVWMRKQLKRQ